jgi:integration host factor subunit beta
MTKSELIERLASQQSHIPAKAVEDAVKEMLEHMASTLAQGERIEIRGFGSFSLHYRAPRTGRNPKTGDKVELEGKYVPHFKPGKNYATAPIFTKSKFRRSATTYLNVKKAPSGAFFMPLNLSLK